MTAITGLLQNIPLLGGLTSAQYDAVSGICERVLCEADHQLITAGYEADAAYYFIDGHVDCLTMAADGSMKTTQIPHGATLLELAMIVEIDASATCVVRSSSKLLKIPRSAMHDLLERDPALTDTVLEALTVRLREMADTMRDAGSDFELELKRSA